MNLSIGVCVNTEGSVDVNHIECYTLVHAGDHAGVCSPAVVVNVVVLLCVLLRDLQQRHLTSKLYYNQSSNICPTCPTCFVSI